MWACLGAKTDDAKDALANVTDALRSGEDTATHAQRAAAEDDAEDDDDAASSSDGDDDDAASACSELTASAAEADTAEGCSAGGSVPAHNKAHKKANAPGGKHWGVPVRFRVHEAALRDIKVHARRSRVPAQCRADRERRRPRGVAGDRRADFGRVAISSTETRGRRETARVASRADPKEMISSLLPSLRRSDAQPPASAAPPPLPPCPPRRSTRGDRSIDRLADCSRCSRATSSRSARAGRG